MLLAPSEVNVGLLPLFTMNDQSNIRLTLCRLVKSIKALVIEVEHSNGWWPRRVTDKGILEGEKCVDKPCKFACITIFNARSQQQALVKGILPGCSCSSRLVVTYCSCFSIYLQCVWEELWPSKWNILFGILDTIQFYENFVFSVAINYC